MRQEGYRSALRHKSSIALMLSFFVIILLEAPGLFPFPYPIIFSFNLFKTGHKTVQ